MKLENFDYFINRRKKTIQVKKVFIFSFGLLFKKSSPPLLFTLKKKKRFSIFSVFCKPFRAIWLDENRHATKIIDIKTWRWRIQGKGKYLLEIPIRK